MFLWFTINPIGPDAPFFHFLFFVLEFIVAIFLFKRRSGIFYGMVFATVIFPLAIFLAIALIFYI
jgi:hypothetical protein